MAKLRLPYVIVLSVGIAVAAVQTASARCFDDAGDAAQIASTRSAIDLACRCFTFGKRSDYVKCTNIVIKARVTGSLLRKDCAPNMKQIYRNSVCGRSIHPTGGPLVPCVTTTFQSGAVSCSLKSALYCYYGAAPGQANVPCESSTSCVAAADGDGDLRVRAPGDTGNCSSGTSLVDNLDGTVTDLTLGLMWEKKSDDGSIHDQDNEYSFPDASAVHVAALNSMSFAGHTDWRLPSVAEAQTLFRRTLPGKHPAELNSGCTPGCDVLACSCPTLLDLWSGTRSTVRETDAWLLQFGTILGMVDTHYELDTKPVRAVRSLP